MKTWFPARWRHLSSLSVQLSPPPLRRYTHQNQWPALGWTAGGVTHACRDVGARAPSGGSSTPPSYGGRRRPPASSLVSSEAAICLSHHWPMVRSAVTFSREQVWKSSLMHHVQQVFLFIYIYLKCHERFFRKVPCPWVIKHIMLLCLYLNYVLCH